MLRAVHERLVREVHEVVDDQLVAALEVDELAVAGPLRVVVPVQVGHAVRVGERRVARPHPDEAVPLHHRDSCARGAAGLIVFCDGMNDAAALGVVDEPVVAAGDVVALELALRQRHQAVPAGVLERDRLAVLAPVQHQAAGRRSCAGAARA